jgi:hypothetical protein
MYVHVELRHKKNVFLNARKAKHEIDHSYAFKCGSFYNCKMLFLVSSFSLSVSPHLGGNLKEDEHR